MGCVHACVQRPGPWHEGLAARCRSRVAWASDGRIPFHFYNIWISLSCRPKPDSISRHATKPMRSPMFPSRTFKQNPRLRQVALGNGQNGNETRNVLESEPSWVGKEIQHVVMCMLNRPDDHLREGVLGSFQTQPPHFAQLPPLCPSPCQKALKTDFVGTPKRDVQLKSSLGSDPSGFHANFQAKDQNSTSPFLHSTPWHCTTAHARHLASEAYRPCLCYCARVRCWQHLASEAWFPILRDVACLVQLQSAAL